MVPLLLERPQPLLDFNSLSLIRTTINMYLIHGGRGGEQATYDMTKNVDGQEEDCVD